VQVIKFIVEDETITLDPTCDLTGLFPGQAEQVMAKFTFSPEWKSKIKVASFWSIMDKEYPPQVINDDESCLIPTEALTKVAFKVQVIGKRRGGAVIKTNSVIVYQIGKQK
jgi:hypothetical protein